MPDSVPDPTRPPRPKPTDEPARVYLISHWLAMNLTSGEQRQLHEIWSRMTRSKSRPPSSNMEMAPCPFCGHGDLLGIDLAPDGRYYRVACGECGASGPVPPPGLGTRRDEVIARWNLRSPDDAMRAAHPSRPVVPNLGADQTRDEVAELLTRAANYDEKPHQLYSHIAVMAQRRGDDEAQRHMLARYEQPAAPADATSSAIDELVRVAKGAVERWHTHLTCGVDYSQVEDDETAEARAQIGRLAARIRHAHETLNEGMARVIRSIDAGPGTLGGSVADQLRALLEPEEEPNGWFRHALERLAKP